MKKLRGALKKITIYLARKDFDCNKVKSYHKKLLYIFSALFLLCVFHYNFSGSGALFGVIISLNIIPAILFSILFIFTSIAFSVYYNYYSTILTDYAESLINKDNVICAFADDVLQKKIYKVKKYKFHSSQDAYYIEIDNNTKYYFEDDHRTFKLVDIKNSRRLKLKKLMEAE